MASPSGALAAPARYRYDAENLLVCTGTASTSLWRYWLDDVVVNTAGDGNELSWPYFAGQRVATRRGGIGGGPTATLLATDPSGSVLMEADFGARNQRYTPYGFLPSKRTELRPAYNGELLDNPSGCYLLGAGHHRPYSPTLHFFLAPDALSPFGDGGTNTYAYCAGDPINRSDPSGHFWNWIMTGVAVIAAVASLGALAAPLIAGAATLTASAIAGAAITTVGAVVEVGGLMAHELGNEKVASILGWVGLATGAVGLAVSFPSVARQAAKAGAFLANKTRKGLSKALKWAVTPPSVPYHRMPDGLARGGLIPGAPPKAAAHAAVKSTVRRTGTPFKGHGRQARSSAPPVQRTLRPLLHKDLVAEAQETLERIRKGLPAHYPKQDGAVFGNQSGFLPQAKRGHYVEYTVPTPGAFDRGGRRLVLGGLNVNGPANVYFSGDHYITFKRVIFHNQMDDWYPYPRPP